MGLFKQRNIRKFHYAQRFHKEEHENHERSLESQWQKIRSSNKRKRSFLTSVPFLVLFLISVLIVWYLLSQYETA